jgi:hypothetical protein
VGDEIDADENDRRHTKDPGQEVLAHVALQRKLRWTKVMAAAVQ